VDVFIGGMLQCEDEEEVVSGAFGHMRSVCCVCIVTQLLLFLLRRWIASLSQWTTLETLASLLISCLTSGTYIDNDKKFVSD
jgi:hypothetical protein